MINKSVLAILLFVFLTTSIYGETVVDAKPNVERSTALLTAIRNGEDVSKILNELENVDLGVLANELDSEVAKKTFWINIYNAHIQLFLTEKPELFENKSSFFKTPKIKIAGELLSFDIIEHGILRRSKAKFGLGIFPKLFPTEIEKKFRVKKTDPRIHMALNCGAKSCPPVAVYEYGRLEEQMDESSRRLLSQTTNYNQSKNTVEIITLFSWFRGDWGNKKAVRNFLKKYDALPAGANPSIKYSKYDWTLLTDNYIDL